MAENQIAEVKQKVDIISVVDSRIKLAKSGRNFKANCPFHGEKTPSFFVSPELQTFKCFGCGEGGDAFTFLQKYEGMDFAESLEYLAEKVGVKLEKGFRDGKEQERKRLLQILHLAEEYYHYLLTEHKIGKRALKYLINRGIDEKMIRTFKIGYSVDGWDGIYKFLVGKKKYLSEEVEKVGLLIRSSGGNRYYDRFRGRVMFPLQSMQGKTFGFSGRVIPGEGVDEKQAKYINSPETPLYRKSEMLYGLTQARKYIRKRDRVIVTEGELDMISSYKAGVYEVVAIKGSALTTEQVELIRRLTKNIVLALDADAAGSEAMKRGIEVADKLGMNLSVVEVVEGKDPDDLAQKDPQAWKKLVKNAISVYDFFIHTTLKHCDVSTGKGKKQASRELAPIISRITNLVEREHYVMEVAEKLGVSKRIFEEEVLRVGKLGSVNKTSRKSVPKNSETRRQKLEKFVVGVFFQLEWGILEKYKSVEGRFFSDLGLLSLWNRVGEVLGKSKESMKIKDVMSKLPMESQRLVQDLFVSEVVVSDQSSEKLDEFFENALSELEKLVVKDEMKSLSGELSDLDLSDPLYVDKQRSLQQKYGDLTRRLKELG